MSGLWMIVHFIPTMMCTVVCQQNIVEQLFYLFAWSYMNDGRHLYGGHSVNKNANVGLAENKNGLLRT